MRVCVAERTRRGTQARPTNYRGIPQKGTCGRSSPEMRYLRKRGEPRRIITGSMRAKNAEKTRVRCRE